MKEEQKNLVLNNGSILDILPALRDSDLQDKHYYLNKNNLVVRNTSVRKRRRKSKTTRRRKSNFSRNNDTSIERHGSQGSSRSRRSSKGRVDRIQSVRSSSSSSGAIEIREKEKDKQHEHSRKKHRCLSDSDTSKRKKEIRNRKGRNKNNINNTRKSSKKLQASSTSIKRLIEIENLESRMLEENKIVSLLDEERMDALLEYLPGLRKSFSNISIARRNPSNSSQQFHSEETDEIIMSHKTWRLQKKKQSKITGEESAKKKNHRVSFMRSMKKIFGR